LTDRANYEGGVDNISVVLFRAKAMDSLPWMQRIRSK